MFLKVSQKSQKNTCARVSFLIKLQASGFLQNTSGRLLLNVKLMETMLFLVFYQYCLLTHCICFIFAEWFTGERRLAIYLWRCERLLAIHYFRKTLHLIVWQSSKYVFACNIFWHWLVIIMVQVCFFREPLYLDPSFFDRLFWVITKLGRTFR